MSALIDDPGRLSAREGDAPPRMQTGERSARVGLLILAGLTVLAGALRFWRISHQGFWFDEGNTALLVHRSLGRMVTLIPQSESTPPLYYGVAWAWARVFSFGEAGLRSLSAVAGVLSVPLAYAAASRLISRRTGLVVAALTACNPLLIWYSQEARSYSLLVMLGAASLAAFAKALDAPRRRPLVAWVVLCAVALATHYYAVVIVLPQALWLLARHRRLRAVQLALSVLLLCGLALIPLALAQNSTGHDSWIAHGPLGIRVAQIAPQLLLGPGAPLREVLKFAGFGLTIGALALLVTRVQAQRRRRALVPAALAGGGMLLALAFVAAGSDALITRNIIGLWLPAAIAVAAGLALSRPAWPGLAAAGALCAIGVTCSVGVSLSPDLQRPDWRLVARAIGPRPATGSTRLLVIQHYRTLLPLSLYLTGLKFGQAARFTGVGEVDVIGMQSPAQPLCWWGAWCNLITSGMQRSYDIPGFHEIWRRRVQHFTVVHLLAGRPRELDAAAVARSLRTTRLGSDDLLVQH